MRASSHRRAGIALQGVGLTGHDVVGRFERPEPPLLDPFGGGVRIDAPAAGARPSGAEALGAELRALRARLN